MTENEIHFRNTDDCIKKIKSIRTMYRDTTSSYVALSYSIQALEEIQQYREIGTIEEIKALKKKEELFDRNIKMFESIGLKIQQKTIDEFVERIVQYCSMSEINRKMIQQIAEEMRGA